MSKPKPTPEQTITAFKDTAYDEFCVLVREFGYGTSQKLTPEQIISLMGVSALSVIARIAMAEWSDAMDQKEKWKVYLEGGDSRGDILGKIFGDVLKKEGE